MTTRTYPLRWRSNVLSTMLLLVTLLVAAAIYFAIAGATINVSTVQSYLETEGFEEVNVVEQGLSLLGIGDCGVLDFKRMVFATTGPDGVQRQLIVCDGPHSDPRIVGVD